MPAERSSPAVLAWLIIFFLVLAWSAVNPHDRLTWWLEVAPALLALVHKITDFQAFLVGVFEVAFGVGQDQAQGRRDPLGLGPATDIEEIGRAAAVQRDRVHGRHREARTVHDAADVAVERDVVQAVAGGLDFFRILLVEVAVGRDFGVAVYRIAIKRHLGIDREQPVVINDGHLN